MWTTADAARRSNGPNIVASGPIWEEQTKPIRDQIEAYCLEQKTKKEDELSVRGLHPEGQAVGGEAGQPA